MKCKNCDSDLNNDIVCQNCGKLIKDESYYNNRGRNKKIALIISTLFFACLTIIALVYYILVYIVGDNADDSSTVDIIGDFDCGDTYIRFSDESIDLDGTINGNVKEFGNITLINEGFYNLGNDTVEVFFEDYNMIGIINNDIIEFYTVDNQLIYECVRD